MPRRGTKKQKIKKKQKNETQTKVRMALQSFIGHNNYFCIWYVVVVLLVSAALRIVSL